jgi:hypothetical protein
VSGGENRVGDRAEKTTGEVETDKKDNEEKKRHEQNQEQELP